MPKNRPTYVIDTNVIIDYVNIIPPLDGSDDDPDQPLIDTRKGLVVIPSPVIRELSSFKGEKSDRGKAARTALKRIREIFKGEPATMMETYHLGGRAIRTVNNQEIALLPVHKNFKKGIPFSPSEDDMDGQIILAALQVAFLNSGLEIDGTANFSELKTDSIIILTNDNGLASRAYERGIRAERYGYRQPEPYTGRRDIVVPKELFYEFYNSRKVERKMFEELMPAERKLVANEFIIMSLENPNDYPSDFTLSMNPYFLHVGRYDQETEAIVPLQYVVDFPVPARNVGQAIYAEALMNPKFAAVICTGPAGSGKTYMATVYGYEACKDGQFIGVTAIPCESRSKLGALPGNLDEKMDPDVQPLKNALQNYVLNEDAKLKKEIETLKKFGTSGAKKRRNENSDEEAPDRRSLKARLKDRVELIWENWFSSVPIELARGRDFSFELAIYDEFQDQNASQADTLIKRIGRDGKIVMTGDIEQIHAPYLDQFNNGLTYASQMLFDNPMVAQVCFTEDEVVRHLLVKLVAQRQKALHEKTLTEA